MESLLTNEQAPPSNTHHSQQNSGTKWQLLIQCRRVRAMISILSAFAKRLFSFITNSLLSGLKRVSLGKTPRFSVEKHPLLTLPSKPNAEECLSCQPPRVWKKGPVLANPSLEMTLRKNHRKEGPKMVGETSAAARKEGVEDEDVKVKTLRHSRPFFNVASNINEKSDDFIRTRKEAMSTEKDL